MRKILGVSAALVLLSACGGPDAEGTIETDEGDVEYSADVDGDVVTIDMTGPDGETVSVRSGAEASGDLPAGFSVYPDAAVVTSTNVNTPDGGGTVIVMTTDATPAEVVAYYREQAEAAGVTIASEATMNGMMLIGGEGEDGTAFSASASPGGDGQTSIQLSVGKGF